MTSLSETISIVIKVVSDAKGALTKTAQELTAVGKAGQTAAAGIASGRSALAACEQAYAQVQKSTIAAKRGLEEAGNAAKKASSDIDKAGKSAKGSSDNFSKMGKSLMGMVAGISVAVVAKQLLDLADTYTMLDARLALVTSSTEELNKVHADLYEVAKRSRTSFVDTADVFNRFAQATKGQGMGLGELVTMTESLNKAFIISGTSGSEAKAAMVQLSQGFSAGVLRGEEFNSVIEQGGRVIGMLTDYLKVDRGELRKMAEDGKLTTDILRNGVAAGAAKVNEELEKMPKTVQQASTTLSTVWGEVVAGANKSSGATNDIAKAILDVAKTVEENKDSIIFLFTEVAEKAAWAIEQIASMGAEIRVLSAVADGKISFGSYIKMTTTDEFKQALKDIDNGTVQIKAKIKTANAELAKLGEGKGSVEKGQEIVALERELKSLEATNTKVKEVTKTGGEVAVNLVEKTKATANEMKELNKHYLVLSEGKKKYEEQLRLIKLAEGAGQFSAYDDKNKALAATARKAVQREWNDLQESQKKLESGAKGANDAWTKFGQTLKGVEAQIANMNKGQELDGLEKTLALQKQLLAGEKDSNSEKSAAITLIDTQIAMYRQQAALMPSSTKSKNGDTEEEQLQVKINDLLIKRAGLQVQLNNSKLMALSEERILSLELDRLDAKKLPTLLARATAESEINRKIAAEKVAYKEQEIRAMEAAGSSVDPSNIIKARTELTALKGELIKVGDEGRRANASAALADMGESWRQSTESVEAYKIAVQEAIDAGVYTAKEGREKMIAAGDDLGAALALGFEKAKDDIRTDAEIMIQIGQELPSQFASGFASMWSDFISGTKSAKEAFMDFARNTINWLLQIITKQMILNAVQSVGGMFSDGGQVGAAQYASGGRIAGNSPTDTADNVPIWATAGEYMQPVRAVRHYGLAFMEMIRTMRLPKSAAMDMLKGFNYRGAMPSFRLAAGGPVPSANMAGAGSTNIQTGDTRLKVINVIDKGMVGDFMKTHEGETAILNMIRRNGSAVRTILGA